MKRSIILAALGGLLLLAAALFVLAGDGDGPADPSAVPVDPGRTYAAGDSIIAPGGAASAGELPAEAGAGEATGPGIAPGTPGSGVAPAAERPGDPSARTGSEEPTGPAGGGARPGAGGEAGTGSAAAPTSTEAAPTQEVEEILRATARRYEGVRALQADFRQELTNTLLGRTTRSTGTLYQRQPDRFLMRFSDPAGDVIVSDGEFFWLYYPSVDPKQVIRSNRGAGGLDLRSQFVGDPVQRFQATSHGTETVAGRTTHVLTLTPREPVGYRRLKAWIDTEDHLVRRFELTEDNGNVRRFDLTDLRVNPTLPDELFRFEPPAGAVVVSR